MNLDDLLNEMSEKIRNRDLSDEYLREHNNSTREEIGIGEYAYGITMIPCEWVYEYLSDYKIVLKENEELLEVKVSASAHNRILELEKENEELKADNYELNNRITDLLENIPVQKIKDKIEELKKKVEELTDEQGYWGGSDLLEQIKVLEEILEKEQ